MSSIVVFDDWEPDRRKIVAALCTEGLAGGEISCAGTESGAKNLVLSDSPRVVICDWQITQENGPEQTSASFISWIWNTEAIKPKPIIVVVSKHEEHRRQMENLPYIQYFFEKPGDLQRLASTMAGFLAPVSMPMMWPVVEHSSTLATPVCSRPMADAVYVVSPNVEPAAISGPSKPYWNSKYLLDQLRSAGAPRESDGKTAEKCGRLVFRGSVVALRGANINKYAVQILLRCATYRARSPSYDLKAIRNKKGALGREPTEAACRAAAEIKAPLRELGFAPSKTGCPFGMTEDFWARLHFILDDDDKMAFQSWTGSIPAQ
jgi:hypothetical protein